MQAIQLRNRSGSHTNLVREQGQTSDLPSTREGLHLRPHLFNGIQIGSVGRKIQRFHSLFHQNLLNSLYMVRAHIVHHNNVSGLKSRKQARSLSNIGQSVPRLSRPGTLLMPFPHSGGWKKGLSLSVAYSTGHDPLPFGMKAPVHTGGSGSY